jgi:hypothetical protein
MPRPPLGVFFRSLCLDSAWHPERMQGVGYVHALLPVLRRESDPRCALRRQAVVFGANPYIATAVIGAVSRLEMEGEADAAARVRDQLAAPFSGAGDVFYWRALRPAAIGLGLALCVAGAPVAGAVLTVFVFALPASWARWRSFQRGVDAGVALLAQRDAVLPPRAWIQPLRALVAFWGGALAAWGATTAAGRGGLELFAVGLALVLGYHADRRHVSPGIAFLILVVLGTVLRHFGLPAGSLR